MYKKPTTSCECNWNCKSLILISPAIIATEKRKNNNAVKIAICAICARYSLVEYDVHIDVFSCSVSICLGYFFFAETLLHLCLSVCSFRLCYSLCVLDAICSLHYPYKQFNPAPGVYFFNWSWVSCSELWGLQSQVCPISCHPVLLFPCATFYTPASQVCYFSVLLSSCWPEISHSS